MKHNDNLAVVVIPVYKPTPSREEEQSLRQCIQVLRDYPITLVCPQSMDTCFYDSIFKQQDKDLQIKRFSNHFFNGINGYNSLMLSSRFYHTFSSYQYMLIYQLDAWVFRDELRYWCEKGYDYIGAPWFNNYGFHEDGNELWSVGNGGFSLRKISYCLKIIEHKGPMKDASKLKSQKSPKNKLYRLLYSLGYQNNVHYFKKDSSLYEDVFFSVYFQDTPFAPNLPSVNEALDFAFEKSPAYLLSQTGHLPFGCHAWMKYDYESFGKRYCRINGEH